MIDSFIHFLGGIGWYEYILFCVLATIWDKLRDILTTLKSINDKIGFSYKD
jgi:uncharacterized membrane protein